MKYTFSTSSVTKKAKLRTRWFAALAFLLFFVIAGVFASAFSFRSSAFNGANGGGVASAESGIAAQSASYSGDAFTVNRYEATVTINADRTVDFRERLVVTMNQSVGTQFYRSLPIDQGDAYFDVSAKRSYTDGRLSEDSFSVIENPDNGDYIDIVVYGGITANVTWAYEFSYSMRSSEATSNGLGLDVVGGGWTVPLNNVTVTVNFPAAPESCAVYSDEYGVAGKRFIDNESWSADKKTLTLTSVFRRLFGGCRNGGVQAPCGRYVVLRGNAFKIAELLGCAGCFGYCSRSVSVSERIIQSAPRNDYRSQREAAGRDGSVDDGADCRRKSR